MHTRTLRNCVRIIILAVVTSNRYAPYRTGVWLKLARMSNFRIRLLVACDYVVTFSYQEHGCCLWGSILENMPLNHEHFISRCPVLGEAPSAVQARLPDPASKPLEFVEIMLHVGTCWIDDLDVQRFLIQFLNKLKVSWALKLSEISH